MKKSILIILMVCVICFTGVYLKGEEALNAKVYGFVKLDAIYETGLSSHGNFTIWAKDPGDNSGLFRVTANQTRLGVNIKGAGFAEFQVSGKVEVDFYGGGPENKALNFMRHAFLEVSNGSFSILAGQYWDIISPLNPSTLNYPVLWGAGNIGYRRPQLSIKNIFKSGKSLFTVQAGIFRTIAGDYNNDGVADGIAAGFPTFQGRVSGRLPLGEQGYIQVGVSGHYGQTKGISTYNTNSLNADLVLALSPKFKILAEYFNGKNLGTLLGGIAQSVNSLLGTEIKAQGFYVNLQSTLTDKLMLSVCYGQDDPDDSTLSTGLRAKNSTCFANLVCALSPSVKVGLELSNWITDYLNLAQQKSFKIQHSWILTF